MRAEDGTAIKEEDIDFLSVLNSHLLLFDLSTEIGQFVERNFDW